MSMWMPLIAIAMAQTAPSAEAEALGVRLAQTGTLAALMPVIVAKDLDELVAEHPDWSEADKAGLRATADELAQAGIARLTAAIGHGYAQKLSLEDLRALVAFNEGPVAKRWRDATPGAVMQAMTAVGQMDFKADARKAYCAKTGKGCPK
jgi:hypothetical protein